MPKAIIKKLEKEKDPNKESDNKEDKKVKKKNVTQKILGYLKKSGPPTPEQS